MTGEGAPVDAAGDGSPAAEPEPDAKRARVAHANQPGEAPVKPAHACRVKKDKQTGEITVIGITAEEKKVPDLEQDAQRFIAEAMQKAAAPFEGRTSTQKNIIDRSIQIALRKKEVAFPRAEAALSSQQRAGPVASDETVERRPGPKKIDVKGKLFLAPLTTVGNLPFRRICKRFGADITCGEMAVSQNLLQGQQSEWALLRRHQDEDLFGVQIAGGSPEMMARTAEIIGRECSIDFLDINCGCPIDLICRKGAGCALMSRPTKLFDIVKSVSSVIDIPLSVKVRIGQTECDPNAHELIPELGRCGASWVTVHGRSKTQRYSRTADWGYVVDKCAPAAQQAGLPLIGNGDVFNWEDVYNRKESLGLSTVMVARGALYKPWIFTEIKEQRHWDISATERFDMYKDFVAKGLEHWGPDEKGVARTRKFLLEWLSFLYRYIPVGLLEHVPITMTHRSPRILGRSNLETLLASPEAKDWVKITELLLGPAPSSFKFQAKHKSNAWG